METKNSLNEVLGNQTFAESKSEGKNEVLGKQNFAEGDSFTEAKSEGKNEVLGKQNFAEGKILLLDSDIGGDCDDVMALDVLLAAHKAGECRLAGFTYSERCPLAPACARAICRSYGEEIPIGSRRTVPGRKDTYSEAVYEAFPRLAAGKSEDAVRLMRRVLAENEKVTFVVTGSLYNVAKLIESQPDDISPLDGASLMREKLEEVAVMGGNFTHQPEICPVPKPPKEDGSRERTPEYNITLDLPESKSFFANCPVPVTVSPFELGCGMISGRPMTEHGRAKTPDSLSYTVHGSAKGRDSWDPVTALYAAYGLTDLLFRTGHGRVTVDDSAVTDFHPGEGNVTLIYAAKPYPEIAAALDRQVMRLFD